MKTAFVFTLVSVLFSAAFAGAKPTCFKALNPQNIEIKVLDSAVSEKALAAQAVLDGTKFVDADGATHFPSLMFKAQSKNLQFITSASQFQDNGTYGVDCDGGSVAVEKVNGILILNSTFLAGDIKKSGEGCAEGTVHFKNLALEEVNCAK